MISAFNISHIVRQSDAYYHAIWFISIAKAKRIER